MRKRIISLAAAAAMAISSMSLTAFAGTVRRTEQEVVTSQTAKKMSESTLYAGEIFVDGVSKLKYLYSDDITATASVLDTTKAFISESQHTGFSELLTTDNLEDGAKGFANSSDANVTMDKDTNWKNARNAAYKLYPTATATKSETVNLFEADDKFAEACTTKYNDVKYVDKSGSDIPFVAPLGLLSLNTKDSTDYVMRDGVLTQIIKRDIVYSVEEVNVLYTKVELSSKQQKLPFELSKPTGVSISANNEKNAFDSCEVRYSQNDSMSAWMTRDADPDEHDNVVKEVNKMGYDAVWITAQVDWSLDSTDDWKCNAGNAVYWPSEGIGDDNIQHLGWWAYVSTLHYPTVANYTTIFQGSPQTNNPDDWAWTGRHVDGDDYSGWKDVLKKDQYTIKDNGEGEKYAVIDLTKHTLYVRVRYKVTARPLEGQDINIVSDWSETAAVGKDAKKVEPIKPGEIEKPEISGLHYTDKEFNNYPVIAFKLAVSDKLKKQLAQVTGANGGIRLEVEARVKGSSEWVGLQGDWEIKAGDMEIALQNLIEKTGSIKKGTPIELRARYWCSQVGVEEDFYTDWATISFSAETVDRIAGNNRFGTAAEIAKAAFPNGADTVVLANGLTFADALAGVPLAANLKAPILLAATNSLPRETTNAIEKLGAKKVIILGGEGAISKKVEKTLKDNKLTVKRLAGQSRFGTATAIAAELNKAPEEIFFVWALNAADALSVGGVAAAKNAPIIYLTTKGKLNADTEAYLKTVKGKVKNAYVIGGEGVIDNDMMKQAGDALGLKVGKTITRVAGKNRYETCVAVNTTFASVLTGTGICVAKGLDFPDALAGGVYAAINREPLFLADSYKLQECQTNYLKEKKATRISVFGGIGAVPDNVVMVIEKASK